mgnify:CR=1 FL=1
MFAVVKKSEGKDTEYLIMTRKLEDADKLAVSYVKQDLDLEEIKGYNVKIYNNHNHKGKSDPIFAKYCLSYPKNHKEEEEKNTNSYWVISSPPIIGVKQELNSVEIDDIDPYYFVKVSA